MIAEIYAKDKKDKKDRLLLKIFNRTRYDTADLANALVTYMNSRGKSFEISTSDRPQFVVVCNWRASKERDYKVEYVNARVRVMCLLAPETAERRKNIVERVGDLNDKEPLASPQIVTGFVSGALSTVVTYWAADDRPAAASLPKVRVHEAPNEPDMTEVVDSACLRFEALTQGNFDRIESGARQVLKKKAGWTSWSKRFGVDMDKEIKSRLPEDKLRWLLAAEENAKEPEGASTDDEAEDDETSNGTYTKFFAKVV